MKISELFNKNKTVFSLEIFPPKKTSSVDTIYDTLDQLKDIHPDFVSVTYGAGGSIVNNLTCEIASIIKNKYGIEAVAHLTCVNCTKEDVDSILDQLKQNNIENILALRGDINPEYTPKKDFKHATDLAGDISKKGGFNISGAGYPECHVEAPSPEEDILNLKKKVEAGVSSLTTQLFFDNNVFYNFMENVRKAGISVPVEAGIMPVTNKKQIERMVSMCGASLPSKFVKMIQKYDGNQEALRDAGIAYAVDQIVDLISNGAEGIHLYTMNNPLVACRISEAIKNLL